jgi:hypothetical protein
MQAQEESVHKTRGLEDGAVVDLGDIFCRSSRVSSSRGSSLGLHQPARQEIKQFLSDQIRRFGKTIGKVPAR